MRQLLVMAVALTVSTAACSGDNGVTRRESPVAAAGQEPVEAPAKAATLTEDMARPYFEDGAAGAAYRKFELEEWAAARAGFQAWLAGDDAPADAAMRARAQLLIAICDAELSQWKDAAAGFEGAIAALPLLGDFLRYEAARARYFTREMDRARELAEKVDPKSIRGADAALLIGDILRARGDHQAIALHYQKYIADRPEGIRLAEAHFRMAEALEATGAHDEAALVYRTITIRWPTASWGKQAVERQKAVSSHLSPERAAELATLNASELLAQGLELYDKMRNPWAASVLEEALAKKGITADETCVAAYHLADSWFKERNRTKSAPLFDKAMTACDATDNVDLQVKAAYQAGRSYDRLSKEPIAAARFARAEEIAKKHDHSYADDARLRQAEAWAEHGDTGKEEALLGNLNELYPEGDMRGEALWRLAWRAYRAGKYDEAVTWLKKQIGSKPLEDKYYAEGQPQYWLGRTYAKLGKTAESIAAYEEAVRKYPLTYYALLALNRLRESHRQRYDALVAELEKAPAGYDPKAPAFALQARDLWSEPGFLRAVELLKLGIGWASEAEFARLGLTAPDGRDEVTDPDEQSKLWAMALLHDRAGRYGPSHWVTRWHLLEYKRSWPTGHNRARWQIAYPRAWWELLEKNATKHGYPIELQIAIVREESAFDPIRESWANAIGLTQMIYPTAVRFGKGTGIEITRENLRDPENNVTIGSNFLGFLWTKWDGHTALVPPSYNAGENAVARWLRERGTWDVDEWAEAVPGDQPRRYSKRVLASYFAYAYLYGGRIPIMKNDIPAAIIPAAKKRKPSGKPRKGYGNYAD